MVSNIETARSEPRTVSREEWLAQGARRFGSDQMDWKFRCPMCGTVASAHDWQRVGAPEGAVGFSCVGRWMPKQRRAFAEA